MMGASRQSSLPEAEPFACQDRCGQRCYALRQIQLRWSIIPAYETSRDVGIYIEFARLRRLRFAIQSRNADRLGRGRFQVGDAREVRRWSIDMGLLSSRPRLMIAFELWTVPDGEFVPFGRKPVRGKILEYNGDSRHGSSGQSIGKSLHSLEG